MYRPRQCSPRSQAYPHDHDHDHVFINSNCDDESFRRTHMALDSARRRLNLADCSTAAVTPKEIEIPVSTGARPVVVASPSIPPALATTTSTARLQPPPPPHSEPHARRHQSQQQQLQQQQKQTSFLQARPRPVAVTHPAPTTAPRRADDNRDDLDCRTTTKTPSSSTRRKRSTRRRSSMETGGTGTGMGGLFPPIVAAQFDPKYAIPLVPDSAGQGL